MKNRAAVFFWWPGFVFLFALVFYIPSYSNYFVGDDYQFLGRTTFRNSFEYFTKSWGYGNEYRPILPFSYALDACFSGDRPIGYHLTNTAFHAANAIVIGLLGIKIGLRRQISTLAAIIYVVDPVVHESVLWISGRPVVLGTFFVLCSCLFFLKASRSEGSSKLYYLVAYIFFVCALGTYESGVVTPLLVAGLSFRTTPVDRRIKDHLLMFAAISVAYIVGWNLFFGFQITRFPVERSLWGAIVNLITGIAHGFHGSLTVIGGLLYGWLLIRFCRSLEGRKLVITGFIWVCVAYAPFLIVRGYADRFAYLSSVAVAVVLAAAVINLGRSKHSAIVCSIFVILYLGAGMQHRIKTWKEAGVIAHTIVRDIKQTAPELPPDRLLVLLNVPSMHKEAYVYLTGLHRALDREYGHEIRVVTEHIPADQSAIVFEYADGHMLRK